jgi:hypothetical protein
MPNFECIHCKKWLRFKDRNPGDIVDCTYCARLNKVPSAPPLDFDPIPFAAEPAAPLLDGEPALSTAESRSTKITASIGASTAIPSGSKNSSLEAFSFASDWFVFSNGRRAGPYSVIELRSMASTGIIVPEDKLARSEDGSGAVNGVQLSFLFDCFPPMRRRLRSRLIDESFDEIGRGLTAFCFFVIFAMPLYGLYALFWSSIISDTRPGNGQPMRLFSNLEWVWLVVLMIYGLVVGCLIWRRKGSGYAAARQYLAIRFAGAIVLAMIAVPAELARYPNDKWRVCFPIFFEAVFFAGSWFSLTNEERIRKSDRDKFRIYLRTLSGPTKPERTNRDDSPPVSLDDDFDAKGVWFVRSQRREAGPFSVDEMIAKASSRSIHPDDMVKPSDGDWRAAGSVPFLQKIFAKQSIRPAPESPTPTTPQTPS